jgi:cobalt/nickel transport system permease protein
VHYITIELWSQGASFVHRRDPRAKFAALLVYLVVIATAHRHLVLLSAGCLAALVALVWRAGLPPLGVMWRAALVLPFSLAFALVTWLAGDAQRAVALLLKSYLSAAGVLALAGTTRLPDLLRGLELAGVPRFLLMVVQFLYRYLFVISEEAGQMRTAAAARGASIGRLLTQRARFRAAGGALAVLFARSYGRADAIHRAMLARGFCGHFPALHTAQWSAADGVFLSLAAAVPCLLRLLVERVAG